MPRTRSSSTSQTQSSASVVSSSEQANHNNLGRIHCPFKNLDGCYDGVGGNGYSKSGFYRHLHDRHLSNPERKAACRERISSDRAVYDACEKSLQQMQMWMCGSCMHIHAWKKTCNSHVGDAIAGPLDGCAVKFLIHGIDKPADILDSDTTDK